jgi:acetylxylan esterase
MILTMIPSLLLIAALTSVALAAPFPFFRRQAACPQNHLIVARGSLEAPGPGSMLSLAEKVMAANPGTTMESVVYPATIDNYDVSSANGTAATEQQLSSFVQKCPSSKVAMMGFSQGAQIVGDALGGGGIQGISRFNQPISRTVSNQVTAVVMYGDPRHITTASFNVGSATKDGVRTPVNSYHFQN